MYVIFKGINILNDIGMNKYNKYISLWIKRYIY